MFTVLKTEFLVTVFLAGFNILIWSREEMVTRKQECLMQAMTDKGIGDRSLSRQRGQRQSNTGTSRLRTKLLSLDFEGSKTKNKECTLQKKLKGKSSED